MKRGYKQTEVGVLPDDWELKPLGAIGRFKNGINKSAEDFGHGYPFVNLLDVFGKSKIRINGDELGLVRSSHEERRAYDLKEGDVLFVRSSVKPDGVGLTTVIKDDLPDAVFSGFLLRFRDNGELVSGYKDHCFFQERFRRFLIARSTVSANTNINQTALKDVFIWFPPNKNEQSAIATALSDVDALLAGLDKLIAKKRDIKQATMQQLLTGKTRLPGFAGAWEVMRLGDLAEITMGRTPSRSISDNWGAGHVWLSIADMKGKFVLESKEEITELAASGMTMVPAGTLMMSFKLSIGRLAFAGRPLYTNEAICAFRQPKCNVEYLYYALSRVDFSLYGKQAVKGYTLNSESLRCVEVLVPNEKEQAGISSMLSDMDAELHQLEAQREKTRLLKQGMMQELLTGRTRLV